MATCCTSSGSATKRASCCLNAVSAAMSCFLAPTRATTAISVGIITTTILLNFYHNRINFSTTFTRLTAQVDKPPAGRHCWTDGYSYMACCRNPHVRTEEKQGFKNKAQLHLEKLPDQFLFGVIWRCISHIPMVDYNSQGVRWNYIKRFLS